MSLDEINRMISRSMGLSNSFTGPNSINKALEKSLGFYKNIAGMDFMNNRVNPAFAIGSTNWLANSQLLQGIALPNNIFNLTKNLSQGIGLSLSHGTDQLALTKALTQGVSNIIENNTFSKLLDTQNTILNQITGLNAMGFSPNQYRNLFNTLGSLSASTAIRGMSSILDSDSYPYLENVANKAEVITNAVVKHQYVTVSDLNDIYSLIDDLNDNIKRIDKSEFTTFGFWLTIIGLFFSIFPLIQQHITASNPNVALETQQHVAEVRSKLIELYHDNINRYTPIRIVRRKCKLYLKPRLKSHVVLIILHSQKLSVINSRGKWIMVTCLDKDSLPVTGWVLKKYLSKIDPK